MKIEKNEEKKFLVGSKGVKLSNTKDADYVVLTHENSHNEFINQEDLWYYNVDELEVLLTWKPPYNYKHKFIYQFDHYFIPDFPIYFSIIEKREEAIEYLKTAAKYNYSNFFKDIRFHQKCQKKVYHFAYLLFILENNNPKLTEEQMNIVQKIHDGDMDINYIDELKRRIYQLS